MVKLLPQKYSMYTIIITSIIDTTIVAVADNDDCDYVDEIFICCPMLLQLLNLI